MKLPGRHGRGDAGTGLVDVIVATGLLSVLVAVTAGLLAGVGKAQLVVATRSYAGVLAQDMLAQAEAMGCGAATGYGTVVDASILTSRCEYGYRRTPSLGDVLLGNQSGPVACPPYHYEPAYPGLPGPACYQVPGMDLRMSGGLSFEWAWPGGTPQCSTLSNGEAVGSPPSALDATATVAWPDQAGQWQQVSATSVEPVPPLLASAWAIGGLGAVAVDVSGGSGAVPVGLVVPAWSQATLPSPMLLAEPQMGGACALFAYVPAGQGYQVWAGSATNVSAPFTVAGGQWAVADIGA